MSVLKHGLLLVSLALLTGCPQSESGPDTGAAPNQAGDPHEHGDGHAHAHPDHGPHGGGLIELGNEDYHAELIHDEKAGTVTIYVLDSSATKPVSIPATEVTVNVKKGDTAEQFKLQAAAGEGDAAGPASQFVSSDPALAEALDSADAEAQLVITIKDTPYRGKIQHDHGHEHGHDHGAH